MATITIPKHWQCLNTEGNQFFTDLANKYLPIFQASTKEDAEDNLVYYMREVVKFGKTDDGQDADITKEVMSEFYDFCKAALSHCNISENIINDIYWDAYDEAYNLA